MILLNLFGFMFLTVPVINPKAAAASTPIQLQGAATLVHITSIDNNTIVSTTG
jgi:hypothetical protein